MQFFGDLSLLPADLQKLIAEIELYSQDFDKYDFFYLFSFESIR